LMYDLTVKRSHTFHVGVGLWLVHNACINWKGFSKGELSAHFKKHGSEFGNISQVEYGRRARIFGTDQRDSIQEVIEGPFLIRYDQSTREVFVGHTKAREIRTYYIADRETTDPLGSAIAYARGLWQR
jgi:hypothetical protein